MKKRIGYIDMAKAIAVAFIIIGHTGLVYNGDNIFGGMPNDLVRFAFTFHLPVFFIASGYFFDINILLDAAFIKKDAKSLLLPYAVTSIIIVAVATIVGFFSPTAHAMEEFSRWLNAALYGAGAVSPVALVPTERIGGLWFLLAMFWARLLIVATGKLKEPKQIIIMLIALCLSVISARYVWLPLSIQSGLECAAFIYAGAYIKKHRLFMPKSIKPPVWATFIILWMICIVWGGRSSMAMCAFPLGVIDIVGGVSACFCIMAFCRFFENRATKLSAALQVVGRNTLAIFTLHIAEDNIIPWGYLGIQLSSVFDGAWYSWIILLLMRFVVDAALVAIAFCIPWVRTVFFPQLRRKTHS